MPLFHTKNLRLARLADGVVVLVLDCRQRSFNVLDLELLHELELALDALVPAQNDRLLLIASAKADHFCHGPSSSTVASWNRETFASWAEQGQKVCSRLVALPVPSVAVIAGSCWDAGLELALACDYRVVVQHAHVSLGFPQLEWGLTPCWGSTQRLPHLIGLEYSLQMLVAAERYSARQAWSSGLADDLADAAGETPPAFLEQPHKRDWHLFPKRNWRQQTLESNRGGRWFLFRGAECILRTRIADEMPAPAEMLHALRIAYAHPDPQPGLDFERQALNRIVEHTALHHLIRLLQQRDALRTPSRSDLPAKQLHVGILGAGVLGLSLLLHGVSKGYLMVLRTHDEASLGAALTRIVQLLQAEVQNENMTPAQYQKTLAALRGTHTWTHFDHLDLVIDTAAGTLADRIAFYRELETRIMDSTLLVAFPMAYRLSEIQPALDQPGRLLGMHMIEPWNRGSLAEIITPQSTSSARVQLLRDWAISLGRCCLDVPDQPGGLVMRIWLPALNEAGLLLREGVPIPRIDAAMRRFGMSYGPCEWMDRLGLDHVALLVRACQPLFTGRLAFENGFALMVEQNWLGNRTGLGFYRHKQARQKPHPRAEQLWRSLGPGKSAKTVPILAIEDMHVWIQQRLVTLMILEAVRCLEEGMVTRADDLDCALCLTGWATHRGGPIGYARQQGYEKIVAICQELEQQQGPRFAPFATLKDFLT